MTLKSHLVLITFLAKALEDICFRPTFRMRERPNNRALRPIKDGDKEALRGLWLVLDGVPVIEYEGASDATKLFARAAFPSDDAQLNLDPASQ